MKRPSANSWPTHRKKARYKRVNRQRAVARAERHNNSGISPEARSFEKGIKHGN